MRLNRYAIVTLVVAIAFSVTACGDKDNSLELSGTSEEDQEETPTTTMPPVETGDVVVNGDSLAEGFEDPSDVDPQSELAFGEEAAEAMANADQERGAAAHRDETVKTVEELTEWLNDANNAKAVPVRARVVDAITEVCGEKDVAVHLEQDEGWLLMVVRPESQIRGTSYMTDSGLQIASNWRQVGENDAYWLPVCTMGENKGDVVWDGVVRADCGNGHDTPKIRINRPETPEVPPVEIPPGENCPFNPALPVDSPDCLKPKEPELDVNVNPDVPPQVRGPGTTPVGEDPGPAEEPVDTPTGCKGACDEDDGFEPTTTTTTRPNQGQGPSGEGTTNTTSPPTTQAPPPAPPTTQEPTTDPTVPAG